MSELDTAFGRQVDRWQAVVGDVQRGSVRNRTDLVFGRAVAAAAILVTPTFVLDNGRNAAVQNQRIPTLDG